MDKFKMELTWHNCKTYPPKEDFNSHLLVTDGWDIKEMRWVKSDGVFVNKYSEIKDEELINWWWADIVQTAHNTKEFKEALK